MAATQRAAEESTAKASPEKEIEKSIETTKSDITETFVKLAKTNILWYSGLASIMGKSLSIYAGAITADNALRTDLKNGFIQGTIHSWQSGLNATASLVESTFKELTSSKSTASN